MVVHFCYCYWRAEFSEGRLQALGYHDYDPFLSRMRLLLLRKYMKILFWTTYKFPTYLFSDWLLATPSPVGIRLVGSFIGGAELMYQLRLVRQTNNRLRDSGMNDQKPCPLHSGLLSCRQLSHARMWYPCIAL